MNKNLDSNIQGLVDQLAKFKAPPIESPNATQLGSDHSLALPLPVKRRVEIWGPCLSQREN